MFKRIKKFYKNNRIYCILMLISMICVLLMGTSVIIYFINQTTSDSYGHRLDGIEDYELGNTLTDLENYYKETEFVTEIIDIRLQGKIIYTHVQVTDETSNEDIQNLATGSLEKMTDEIKSYYELQFLFDRPSYPTYSGSKGPSKTVISWSKYSFDTGETTTTTKK